MRNKVWSGMMKRGREKVRKDTAGYIHYIVACQQHCCRGWHHRETHLMTLLIMAVLIGIWRWCLDNTLPLTGLAKYTNSCFHD